MMEFLKYIPYNINITCLWCDGVKGEMAVEPVTVAQDCVSALVSVIPLAIF